MNKRATSLLFLTMFFALLTNAHGQSYSALIGSWQGAVIVEMDTHMVVIDITGDTLLEISYNMPWSGIVNSNTNKNYYDGESLSFTIPSLQISYNGVFDAEKKCIHGFLKQGKDYPLTLCKTDTPIRLNRPQTPIEPFPYISEEVMIVNKKSKNTLGATLTLPKGNGPFPAVVLVTGSGAQDRNEELLGHKPFLVIADYFTRNGIAVLRYDDRGVGKSTGKFANSTTLDFATDADAVFNFLKSDGRIDKNKVGIIGHSEGGLIAPIVASKNKSVKFVIMLAGPGVDGRAIMLEQYRLILLASSIPDSVVTPLVDLNRQAFEVVLTTKDIKIVSEKIRAITDSTIQKIGKENAKKYKLTKNTANQLIMQLTSTWMMEFARLNPADYIPKVNCPILALNGELDLQVPFMQNIPAIKALVAKNKKGNLKAVTFPGLNHLFQTATTGSPSEYARIEETINQAVLEEMLNFIKKL